MNREEDFNAPFPPREGGENIPGPVDAPADGDDERLESLLEPLRAPDHLAEAVKLAVRRDAARPRRKWPRAVAAAVLLLLGLGAGILVPIGQEGSTGEAKAAALKCDIAAYDRGAHFVEEESPLLSGSPPEISALVFLNHLALAGVAERGRKILSTLESESGGLPQRETARLRAFFSKAVGGWSEMKALAADGALSPEEIRKLREAMPSLLPPHDILAFALPDISSAATPVKLEVRDAILRDYLKAKRFIYEGRYDLAVPLLNAVMESNGDRSMAFRVSFWKFRCSPDSEPSWLLLPSHPAGMEIFFRRKAVIPKIEAQQIRIYSVGGRNSTVAAFTLQDKSYAAFIYPDGSVGICDEDGAFRKYSSMEELRKDNPALYEHLEHSGSGAPKP